MKNKFPKFLIITGFLCIAYDITLILLNPGTFWDNFFAFTHIWSFLGIILIVNSFYKIKKGFWLFSKFRRWLKITIVSLFTLFGIIALVNLIFILNPKTTEMGEDSDYLILLGGGISKDGNLPKSVITRVEKAAEYLKLHPDCICVVTGGTLNWLPYAEAPAIKKYLVKEGISEERIFLEDKAKDTIQNLQFSCKVISKYKNISQQEVLQAKIVIVTSRFHLRRAERLAKRLGYKNVKGLGSKCPLIYIPHNYFREVCAYIKLNLRILLTGKPEQI